MSERDESLRVSSQQSRSRARFSAASRRSVLISPRASIREGHADQSSFLPRTSRPAFLAPATAAVPRLRMPPESAPPATMRSGRMRCFLSTTVVRQKAPAARVERAELALIMNMRI